MKAELSKRGIPTMVYYPIPLHQQKSFDSVSYPKGSFPVSESLCNIVLSLPVHTEMNYEMVQEITRNLIQVYQELN